MESPTKSVLLQGAQDGASEQLDPSVSLAQEIVHLWAEYLTEHEVGPDGNFFECGGNSLIGIQILERISQMYGVELSVRAFYLAQTPARVAELIERDKALT